MTNGAMRVMIYQLQVRNAELQRRAESKERGLIELAKRNSELVRTNEKLNKLNIQFHEAVHKI